jgi:hypothetical protein
VVGDGFEPLAVLEVIELDDDAVDLVIERAPLYSPPRVVFDLQGQPLTAYWA